MLTASSSIAFNEGYSDAINGHDPVFAEDSAYMAGWELGRTELIGKSFDKVEQNGMKQEDIIGWLEYWDNARMVAIDQINAFDQVHQARKYCSCMRTGVFAPDLVSDLQIWRALLAKRAAAGPEWRNLPTIVAIP